MRLLRSNIKRLAVASAAAAGLSFMAMPSAWANNATDTNPLSGSQTQSFLFDTTSAACPLASNQPNGDLLDSFVVDNQVVAPSQLGQLTFSGNLPNFGSYVGATLITPGGNPYVNSPTLPPTPPGTAGQFGPDTQGPFSWNPYVTLNDYGANLDLHDGTFNVGIACVKPDGTIDNNQFWSLQVTFTSASNAPPFTWSSQPGPSTPEVPFAVILPISGVALLLVGAFLFRRRQLRALVSST
jgi:hypothetical protein